MEDTHENANNLAIVNGLVIGFITIVIQLASYYFLPHLLGNMFYGVVVMVISLAVYIIFTVDLRKKVGGYWSFREALKGIFLMAFIAGVFSSAVTNLFYKFIEPNAFEKVSGYVLNGLSSTYEKLGMSQDKIDETIGDVESSLKSQYDPTVAQFFRTLSFAILVQFIMSLIFAAVFKKEAPYFHQSDEE